MNKQLLVTSITIFFLSILDGFSQVDQTSTISEKSEKIISLAKENIYNAALLESNEWAQFAAFIKSEELNKLQGQEYVTAFNEKSNQLPFSHFYLSYTGKDRTAAKKQIPFELEEVSKETVILHLRKFVADGPAMVKIVQEIEVKGYQNLIVDMRNNSGGTLDAAVVLMQYLSNNPIDAGIFVTRKWYNENSAQPSKEDIKGFAFLQDMTHEGFFKIQQEPAFRLAMPGHSNPTFKGKVFVLTNNLTGSASEPVAHIFKTQMKATVIGEKTAGQMLSAEWFDVDDNISLFIPTNDYITAEGIRLDQVGVSPDIETSSDEALDKALNLIK